MSEKDKNADSTEQAPDEKRTEPMTEEEIYQRLVEKKAGMDDKKRGRPKNENYLPWPEIRDFIRSEMLPSRGKFFEWHDRNKPKAVPRFPYRVYQKEWITWNDFLGTNNKFNEKIGTDWKDLTQASIFVHTLKIQTQAQWMDYARSDAIPKDIPQRPDLVYNGWRSWGHWLGNKPVEAIQVKQDALRQQVYFIIHEPGYPLNVLTYGIETSLAEMKIRWERDKFEIVKLFWYDPSKSAAIAEIVNAFSSPYQGYDRQRITPNVWEIVYHMQTQLQLEQITNKHV